MQEQGQVRQGCLEADISGQGIVQRQIVQRPGKIGKIFTLHHERFFRIEVEQVK